ncbi:hypothetical protein BKA63DRAFT_550278 [Paraphoma chrysanthemicola]|nr:hypothetical protein BKA63DRAFT_550278 [Paraphoma chrysanthemicola]
MEQVSPLLLLPGELRNRIYAYSLSEERGISHREDKNGIAWPCLCKHNGDVQTLPVAEDIPGSATAVVESNQEIDKDSHILKRRKLNTGKHKEPLFRAHKIESDARVRACNTRYIVANQLQFVNRQLRDEAQGLGLRCNDIYDFCSLESVLNFLKSLSHTQRTWLRRLVVRQDHSQDKSVDESTHDENLYNGESEDKCEKRFSHWRRMEQMYFKLAIHIYSSCSLVQNGTFLGTPLMLQYNGRGNKSFVENFSSNIDAQRALAEMAGEGGRPLPTCVKWFPGEETFDEAAFRANCAATDIIASTLQDLGHTDGVRYREENGVDWLCLHSKQHEDVVKNRGNGKATNKLNLIVINNDQDIHSLDADSGVLDFRVRVNQEKHIVANQLRYVCRQLRQETSRLISCYNTITFLGSNGLQSMQLLANFLASVRKHRRNQVSSIVVRVLSD